MFANFAILFVLSLSWASGYVLAARVDQSLPPITATASLTIAGTLFLIIFVRVVMRRPLWPTLRRQPLTPLIMAVSAVGVPVLGTVAAEKTISAGLAAVLGTTLPILTYLTTVFILKTTPKRFSSLVGVVIAVYGMIVFANPGALLRNPAELQGIAILVGSLTVFVANGLYAAERTSELDPYVLIVWVMGFAAVGLAALAFIVEGAPTAMLSPGTLIAVLADGALPMALGYLLYYSLLHRAGAAFTSLYAFLVPPLGVVLGALFAGGALDFRHLAGVAIILVGLWLVLRPPGNQETR